MVWFLSTSFALNAQTVRDSILVSERKTDRPLTLHKGQLQFNAAYGISIISGEYDNERNIVSLTEKGMASVMHKYYLGIGYGVVDFLQFSTALNYASRGQRHETRYLWTTYGDVQDIEITEFDEYRGFEDLYLGAVFKFPFNTRTIEIALTPGIYLPLFSNKPDKPENSIELSTTQQPTTRILYHNNHSYGNGILVMEFGTVAMLRPLRNLNISARVNYRGPYAETKMIRWIHQLDGSVFNYDAIPYLYVLGNTLDYKIDLSYQAISWFCVTLSWSGRNTTGGWSEVTGYRIKNRDTNLSLVSLGYEINATGRLWITESVNVPVYGRNELSPFSINLGISYNLFPFDKKIR